MKKVEVDISTVTRLINHSPVVFVLTGDGDKTNVMTVAWNMVVSKNPPMLAVSIGKSRYSHGLVRRSREFVISVPHAGLINELWCCGRVSGREVDKFAETGLKKMKSLKVSVPSICQCVANIECRVESEVEAGDHTIFIGKILGGQMDDGIMNEDGVIVPDKAKTFHHLGGNYFELHGRVVTV